MKPVYIFADISGFTRLTEEFIENSRYGAEHITDMLSSVFSPSINYIYKTGGYVLLFAGDAMLFAVPHSKRHTVENKITGYLNDYNKSNKRKLGISFETPGNRYYPHLIKCNKRDFVFFHENKTELKYTDIRDNINISYPPEILKIKKRHFSGELATLPVFFINMRERNLSKKVKSFYGNMIDRADTMGVYINKIEYADKGGMILLSAGAPKFIEKAPLKCIEFLSETMEEAARENINMAAGGTLGKCYAGIIGNDNRWEYTFIGSSVNLAARIAVKADTGKMFADLKLQNYLRKYFDTVFVDKISFKGIDEPVEVYQIENRIASQSRTVIRDEPLLRQSGQYIRKPLSIITIEGEGGTGKTVFLDGLESKIKGCIVSVKSFREDMPYSLLIRILEDINLRRNLIKQNIGSDSVKSFRNLGHNIKERTTIIIDDSHNMNAEDIEEFKKASFKRNNINYIFCGRPDNRMGFLYSHACKYRIMNIEMRGFDREKTKEYIEKRTSCLISSKHLDKIQDMSGGNPLFISEIINFMIHENMIETKGKYIKFKTDISQIPYSISELILSKFKDMNTRERGFLKAGSLIGEKFKIHVPAALNNFEQEEIKRFLASAESINILNPAKENTIAFYHSIVRETIYDIMLLKEIKSLSLKIGDILSKSSEPEDILQAGYFYQLSGSSKASNMYLKAAEEFSDSGHFHYALHSYKNFLKVKPHSTILKQSFNVFREINKHKIDGESVYLLYKRIIRYKNIESSMIILISRLLVNILGDTESSRQLLDKHRDKLKGNMQYMLTMADIDAKENNIDNAVKIYECLKNRDFKNSMEKMRFYAKYGQFSFIMVSSRSKTDKALKITKSLRKEVDDNDTLIAYYNFLITVYLHRNYMKKAKDAADKLMAIAVETNNEDIKANMYNTYSIIYSAMAWERKEPFFEKKGFEYAEKMMDIAMRDMNLNALPLMTSNLGVGYLRRGEIARGMNLLYDSLAYGREIKHPIEVPYTMSLIGYFCYLQGDYATAEKMSRDVMENYPAIDMRGLSGMILFILCNDTDALQDARKMNESSAENGHFMPYSYFYSALFYHHMVSDKNEDMSKLASELRAFIKRAQLRPSAELSFRARINICDILSGKSSKKTVKELKEYVSLSERMHIGGNVNASAYLALASNEERRAKKIELLRKGYFTAKRYRQQPLIKRIMDIYIDMDYNKYYYMRKLKALKGK